MIQIQLRLERFKGSGGKFSARVKVAKYQVDLGIVN